jgi:hypothetical protein
MQPTLSVSQFKANFFDRIKDKAEKAKIKNLSKAGAFVRRTAKGSLKYRKVEKDAPAGKPPYVHRSEKFTVEKRNRKTGVTRRQSASPLRELLFFAYDAKAKSVVIGPAFLQSRGGKTVPEIQEKGGTISVRRVVRQVRGNRARSQAQADAFRRLVQSGAIIPAQGKPSITTRAVTIKPHPYMGPAMRKEIESGKIAGVWANSVK